ncbi:MAG: hypothetical protein ACKOE6_11210 [Flammeovirgaceae bacterium]
MNKLKLILFFLFTATCVSAQTAKRDTSFTYAEIRFGYGVSSFGSGLTEAYEAGNFSTSAGVLATLAAYHKFKRVNHLVFGFKFKSLGAAPSNGDNGQQMFFNYWGAAVTTKYFPLTKSANRGLFLQADFFFVTQFTQKYRTTSALQFNHQFAIGNGFAIGMGYELPLKRNAITFGIEYESDTRRGEVTGVGDKTFQSSNLGFLVGYRF